MAVLVSAHEIKKTFGIQTLFSGITFSIESQQKIGLIGPNGAGKSTLLRILSQKITPDKGSVSFNKGLAVGYLEQLPQFKKDETVLDALLEGTNDTDPAIHAKAYELISKLQLEEETYAGMKSVSELSGGWLKRVALARELMKDPQLLLLDEPTNHLDITSIQWLEEYLAQQSHLATMIITHDRLFLQNTCDHIFDLDIKNPDGLIKYQGTYADFLDLKESLIGAQKNLLSSQKNTLRRETEWLRRGAKARQTKQVARIHRAHDLKDDVQNLQFVLRERKVTFDFGEREHNPKKIIEVENASLQRDNKVLFTDFSHIFGGKTRTGIIGSNGCGKTSLLKMMIGDLAPTKGKVKIAEGLKISYFSQKKEDLNPEISVLRTLCPQGDYVQLHGKPVYAKSYLSRFHFRQDQMDLPVGKISGGEQSRLLLAQLMLQAESVLILDEPTNDLDIETLDSLQEALENFPGAVILVSHDRYFMDQVCTEIIAFDEVNKKIEKFANVLQWNDWSLAQRSATSSPTSPTPLKTESPPSNSKKSNKKLSFKEQHELDKMEEVILTEETKLADLEAELSKPDMQSQYEKLTAATQAYQAQKTHIENLYSRWQELKDKT